MKTYTSEQYWRRVHSAVGDNFFGDPKTPPAVAPPVACEPKIGGAALYGMVPRTDAGYADTGEKPDDRRAFTKRLSVKQYLKMPPKQICTRTVILLQYPRYQRQWRLGYILN